MTSTAEPLHRRIRRHRLRADLTQQQVADRLGCTRSHVANIESGRVAAIGADQLATLAEMFGTTMDILYWGSVVR